MERMLVAVGHGLAVVLEVSGSALEAEMANDPGGLHDEVLEACRDEEGILVWEGVPNPQWSGDHYLSSATEFEGYQYDPAGFREPTLEEWEAIRAKRRPWPYVGALKEQAELDPEPTP